ncbi:MAG: endonuclease III [Candidatus Woesearchaeota archaeon]
MNQKARAEKILTRLSKEYPHFITALDWSTPWQLLVAVVLSAQTTDENVNNVTKELFTKYSSPKQIAAAPLEELEQDIYSTGYYKSKARNLKKLCEQLAENNNEVPDNMQELITLAGVGRKTANVVLHILYNKAEGIVMDTHIARVTNRLGYTKQKNPEKAEKKMMQVLDSKDWRAWGDLLIQHGREVCHARKPRCNECVLNNLCPSANNI